MASSLWTGMARLTRGVCQTRITNVIVESNRSIFLQSCLFRARRGTRERKLKMLKKRKAQKATAELKKKMNAPKQKLKDGKEYISKRIDDSHLEVAQDNVWVANMFKLRLFSFEEAVDAHRQIHHPTMYNQPNGPLHAYIELDMSTDKKTKFYEGFSNVVAVKYPYPHREDRSILAFCKLREQIDEALEAGAIRAGGAEIIMNIKRGKVTLPDFQFIIAHPNIMHELAVIRGLLRNKYPDVEKGTMGPDIPGMIRNFRTGIRYEAKRDEFEPKYGWIDVQLGTLDMEIPHLEDNLRSLLADVRQRGPKRTKNTEGYSFLTRCFLSTPLKQEKLLIPMNDYLEDLPEVDSDDDEDEVAAA